MCLFFYFLMNRIDTNFNKLRTDDNDFRPIYSNYDYFFGSVFYKSAGRIQCVGYSLTPT